jgi:Domain of unknown function (DUF4760)
MSAEWVTAIATVGTFLVIAASAIAALIQLRHLRGGNQIAAITGFREALDEPDIADAMYFGLWELPERLQNPEVRRALLARDWSGVPPEYRRLAKVANLFENMGVLVKNGVIHPNIMCDLWSHTVVRNWKAMCPVIHNRRQLLHNPSVNENFEYIAALAARWMEAHPLGAYPKNAPRMPSTEVWPELSEHV